MKISGDERQPPNQFPRTYSIGVRSRRASNAIATAPAGIVIGVLVLRLFGLVDKSVSTAGILGFGFFAALCAFLIYRGTRRQVVLREDGITVSGYFSTRTLKYSEILSHGTEGGSYFGGFHYVIIPADKTSRVLRLPAYLNTDRDFYSWMKSLPLVKKQQWGARIY